MTPIVDVSGFRERQRNAGVGPGKLTPPASVSIRGVRSGIMYARHLVNPGRDYLAGSAYGCRVSTEYRAPTFGRHISYLLMLISCA